MQVLALMFDRQKRRPLKRPQCASVVLSFRVPQKNSCSSRFVVCHSAQDSPVQHVHLQELETRQD